MIAGRLPGGGHTLHMPTPPLAPPGTSRYYACSRSGIKPLDPVSTRVVRHAETSRGKFG